MHDSLVKDNLESIIECIELTENRFSNINEPSDFVSSSTGLLILDAISMRLQIIGELLKKIDKSDSSFLKKYPDMEWDNIMRLRDIISHHYDIIDHEIIFDICKSHIPKLKTAINNIIQDV